MKPGGSRGCRRLTVSMVCSKMAARRVVAGAGKQTAPPRVWQNGWMVSQQDAMIVQRQRRVGIAGIGAR